MIKSFSKIDDLILKISDEINTIIKEKNINEERVLGIGFSLPGTVNEKKMVLELAPNLNMKNINFKQFGSVFKLPYYIENEANCGAVAEYILSGSKANNFIYISITQGVGTGIIMNGHLYKGKNQRAGEFGHMVIIPKGKKCNCGRNGCWELYVSEKALLENYFEQSGERVDIDSFISLVINQNEMALKVWNEYLEYLAIGIENLILGLDPSIIVIGGNVAKYEDLIIEPIKKNIFSKEGFEGIDDVKIVASKLISKAPLLGAALLPIQKVIG